LVGEPKTDRHFSMLARFRVLLPYTFSVRVDDACAPEEFERDGYRIKVYPPYQAATSIDALANPTTPVSDVLAALHPREPIARDETIDIDGRPTFRANALQIDVLKDDFDRRPTGPDSPGADDPPVDMLFEVVNSLLFRLRSVGRAITLHPIERKRSCWRIEFLNDAGEPLALERGKARARNGAAFSLRTTGFTEPYWRTATGLPRDFRTQAWEALLLDAEDHLPELTPALVLAAASLETLIGSALAAVPPEERTAAELWKFVNDRGDYRKEPSVAEQYDQLLHALTGHSLKERAELWTAFQNLRSARNSLMHEGALAIGGVAVTQEQAYALIARAKEIADWIEGLLPPVARRPGAAPLMQFHVTRPLIANR